VFRTRTNGEPQSLIDPYGWNGSGVDPWLQNSLGAESLNLWDDGVGPDRFLELSSKPNPCRGCRAPVAVTKIRFMGPDDISTPNNEYVELSLDRRFSKSPRQLKGYRIRNNAGATYRFRRSFKLKAGKPVRIFSGSGVDTASTLFWKQSSGQWDNNGDCVQIFDEKGRLAYFFFTNTKNCRYLKGQGSASIRASMSAPAPVPIEYAPRRQ
jgi:hypothetical protein